jgi:hypothetical protein
MWRTVLVILCVLLFPWSTLGQEGATSAPFLRISAAENVQSFEVEVKSSTGVRKCEQLVTSRNPCKLENIPAEIVTVVAKIGEKQMKEMQLKVSPVGAEVFIRRDSLSLVIFSGTVAALSAAVLTFEIIEGNVAQIIESSVILGISAGATAYLLLRGRDHLLANGKIIKKDGSLRAMLFPTIDPFAEKPTVGLGAVIRW